ncbi:MAG: cytochrome c biogenesis protein CcsA [Planctomycetota bacterium]
MPARTFFLLTVLGCAADGTVPPLSASLDPSGVRAVVVQHDGRWMPLETAARDYVQGITGAESFAGQDPALILLAWTFDASTWKGVPLIAVANAELRREIGLPAAQTVFSYDELVARKELHLLTDELALLEEGEKLDPLQSTVARIHRQLLALQQAFLGEALRLVPDPTDGAAPWRTIAWLMEAESREMQPVREAWLSVHRAFVAGDGPSFSRAVGSLQEALNGLPAAYRPPARRIEMELEYNRLRPFRTAWIAMAIGLVLAAAAILVRRRWFDGVASIALLAGVGILTYGLYLRGSIAGRLPAANMFESLLFLSWGAGAFAAVAWAFTRHRGVPLTAAIMAALSLCLADLLPLDQFIRPVPPVLCDTVWMSIHVPVIMVSYSVLTLAVAVAHVQIVAMSVAPRRTRMAAALDTAHAWYMHAGAILLFVGIATGSIWAASSWGRSWGWDPKEVWSLIALLGYMTIMHVRIDHERESRRTTALGALLGLALVAPALARFSPGGLTLGAGALALGAVVYFVAAKGPFAVAVKSILAFWLILMTYVGVNYVLGIGLHSYNFGTGVIAERVFLIGGLDLSIVAGCGLLRARQRVRAPA